VHSGPLYIWRQPGEYEKMQGSKRAEAKKFGAYVAKHEGYCPPRVLLVRPLGSQTWRPRNNEETEGGCSRYWCWHQSLCIVRW
jgi:hypothetical protein